MSLTDLRAQATVPVGDSHTWPNPVGMMSVTLEDADFLYALVRVTRPLAVVETGAAPGISARFIAEALADNGVGQLTTYEPNEQWVGGARDLLAGLPAKVHGRPCPREYVDADLVYIDSDWQLRDREITFWLTCGYRGLVVVHDANRRYPELAAGDGVFVPGQDGFWIGRGR